LWTQNAIPKATKPGKNNERNSKQLMPKVIVSSHSSKKLKAQNFLKIGEVRGRKTSPVSRVLLLNHHLKCYRRLATNTEKKIT